MNTLRRTISSLPFKLRIFGNSRKNLKQEDSHEDRGTVWFDYVQRQLDAEHDRFKTLDNKGNTLITSSGTFVTLIFAVGALTINRTGFVPSRSAVVLALIGLALFVLAALSGVMVTSAVRYVALSSTSLESIRVTKRWWNATERAARRTLMRWDVESLRTLRVANRRKSRVLRCGHLLQIAAALVLSSSAGVALLS
jgi:hypothetical protein